MLKPCVFVFLEKNVIGIFLFLPVVITFCFWLQLIFSCSDIMFFDILLLSLTLMQRKINKFLDYKKAGKSFNAEVRNRKDYRNPDFLLHAVRYQDIDQTGSCFSKDVFDPHGYDKSDYYDEIGLYNFFLTALCLHECTFCVCLHMHVPHGVLLSS